MKSYIQELQGPDAETMKTRQENLKESDDKWFKDHDKEKKKPK